MALKADVEALFMTAPSVSLAELAHEVADAHAHLDSQARLPRCWQLTVGHAFAWRPGLYNFRLSARVGSVTVEAVCCLGRRP